MLCTLRYSYRRKVLIWAQVLDDVLLAISNEKARLDLGRLNGFLSKVLVYDT